MVRGQARDLGEPAARDAGRARTATRGEDRALFRAALEIGGAAAGADEPTTRALARYGECYGVAFQHADDLDDADHPGHAAAARQRVTALIDAKPGLNAARRASRPRAAALLEVLRTRAAQRGAGAAA